MESKYSFYCFKDVKMFTATFAQKRCSVPSLKYVYDCTHYDDYHYDEEL